MNLITINFYIFDYKLKSLKKILKNLIVSILIISNNY